MSGNCSAGRLNLLPAVAGAVIVFVATAISSPIASCSEGSGVPTSAPISHGVAIGRDGVFVTDRDHSAQLRVHGYIQADGRFFSSDLKNQSPDQFLFRRIRPTFDGTLFKVIEFTFMPDFGQNNPQIQELYLELRFLPFAKPRVGKFKVPVGLEALRSDSDSSFAERSLASDLVPLRELGMQVSGALLNKSLSYAAGYFNGAPDGSNGSFQWRSSREGAGQLFLRPFLHRPAGVLRGLGVGLGGSFAQEHGTLPRFKTVGQNTFFAYSSGTMAAGRHSRVSPQGWYYRGPVGILGEYTISSQEVRNPLATRQLSNQAWHATASLMLTGEQNSYTGVRPHRAFEPQKGLRHLGGWELAVRYSRLRVDKNAFPLFADPDTAAAGAAERGVALNWYLNRFARIVNSYEHTSFTVVLPRVAPLHSENVLVSRIQLAF